MEQTISSDFIRGHIDTIILRSLFSGTKHALEIAAFIEEKSGNKYEVKQATLYSALKRLEKQKYVRPFWNDAPEGGRRRYFEITPAGKAFADKNLSEWDYSRDVIDQLVDEVPKNLVHEPGFVLSPEKENTERIRRPRSVPIIETAEKSEKTEEEKAAELAAKETEERERAERERLEAEERERAERERKEAEERERAERERLEAERLERERILREEQERREREALERERIMLEREREAAAERERIALERQRAAEEQEKRRQAESAKDPALEKILNTSQDDVNYREVLSRLLETNLKKSPAEPAEPRPREERAEAERTDIFEQKTVYEETSIPPQIRKESVFDKDIRIKARNTGKTDFSDLLEKADAEGYKIRISTGKTEKGSGKYLVNRINLFSSLCTFLVFLAECLILSIVYKNDGFLNGWYFLPAILIAAILPVTAIVLHYKEPMRAKANFNFSAIYTALIILFQLLIIVVALVLLFNTDFSSPAEVAGRLVVPVLVLFDAFLFFLIRNLCALSGYFLKKK